MRFLALLSLFFAFSMLFSADGVLAIESNSSSSQSSSEDIVIVINVSKDRVSPGESIVVTGKVKMGGEPVDGSVRVKLDDEYTVPLKYGAFKLEKVLSETTRSGEREITVRFTGLSGEEKTEKEEIYVVPTATQLEVYTSSNSLNPGDSINASAILRDQNGEKIDAEMVMTLYDSRGATIMQKKLREGGIEYPLPRDAVPGEWWIYAFSEDVKARRFFTVQEYPKISVELRGDEVRVKNMGNVAYAKPLIITFTKEKFSETETVSLSLGVGEEEAFNVEAPDGEYNVQLNSGELETFFSGVQLTGAAVGVRSRYTGEQVFVAAAFLLLVLLLAAFIKFKALIKKVGEKLVKHGSEPAPAAAQGS